MIKNIEQKVIKFIDEKNLIEKKDRILIALSGGPDSVFLLHFLNKFKKRYQIELGALHLNHKLRGKEADKDEEFCSRICTNLKIRYFPIKKNVKVFAEKRKISFEEAGRELRYSVLESTALKNKFNKIATAHNSNDNVETILLNLIKGSGIRGISGIPVKRNNIIRPVIIISKEDILYYLRKNKLSYMIDKTNLSSDYERNFLRNEIVPSIKSRLNPSLEDTLFHSSEIFKRFSLFVDEKIKQFLSTVQFSKKDNILKIFPDKLKSLDGVFWGDFLKEVVKRNFLVQLTFNDIDKLILLANSRTGKKINLSENLFAFKERNEILISKKSFDEEIFVPRKIGIDEQVKLNGKVLQIKSIQIDKVKITNEKNREYISADRCSDEFEIRRWKAGERFFPIGLKELGTDKPGSKKISDFLNEAKIPSILKKKQLVLISNNQIVWIIGLRLDERFKLTEKTRKIYELCLI